MNIRNLMRPIPRFWLFGFSAALLIAADAAWKSKQIPEWDEGDLKQFLADSPWAKTVKATLLPELTPDQRREGGASGGGKGVGLKALQGVSLTGIGLASQPAKISTTSARVVTLRWESALPVRAAEMKAHEIGAPDWQSDDYVIAVYQVPGLDADQKSLAGELKKIAALKRDRKKDLKPSRVEAWQEDSGHATVVYFFPRSGEITEADKRIDFVAQIGRLCVARSFYTEEMQFQGKLEL